MKKIILGLGVLMMFGLTSCEKGSSDKYEIVNRKNAIFLVDKQTGEVTMMNLLIKKGEGVIGSEWKKMGSPENAK